MHKLIFTTTLFIYHHLLYMFRTIHVLLDYCPQDKFKESSDLPRRAGYEHVDTGLVLGVSWPGLGAVVLSRPGPCVVDQTLVHHVGDTAGSRQQQHLTLDRL